MAVALDCVTRNDSYQISFPAFTCGGFDCHTEHFMNILSLNPCETVTAREIRRFQQGL